ncbi:UDP-N-acetylmuramate--L-alanine ligase [Maribellus sp. CM-23]|uniref:UDP-N-acetylmuramate--L-alanine ligase n=1 Tax=Maribellus sp. CM-23 TaxID=2781026 RepID=UPI001F430C4E|nr:UDP-N-acetylmuramate--L-alanine ligase [Maribellus sp. CM-23]MCE4563272.1 UDP-N-acetylmuramate--L-alanine ligase [Maribellus sp. CM-23]
MKSIEKIKNVYFLGIGGIGMSALARYFKYTGKNVAGYDRTQTALTDTLQEEGIDVHFEDDIRNIPSKWNPAETIAVYTPALPDEHKELNWFKSQPIGLFKRAKVLGLIANEKSAIAVAGTHGKTTTSTMVANILNKTPEGCGAFLGGISKNFGSNLVLPKEESPWIVAEADEFDRSFLHLQPLLALVTSVDADHLDIYGDKARIVESFEKFISQIREEGKLVIKKGVELDTSKTKAQVFTYSLKDDTDFAALNLKLDEISGTYGFDLKTPDGIIANCKMEYPGLVNVENAIGAASLAWLAGVGANELKAGIQDYHGVARRFDVRFRSEKKIYIDDYAHHPEELKAFISSVKALYPGKKVTGIFQPHLYSRTRDFAAEFATSLDLLDHAVLLPLYPAREEPIKGVSSEIIFDKMALEAKQLVEKTELEGLLRNDQNEIILTMGAGDIDRMVKPIVELLQQEQGV